MKARKKATHKSTKALAAAGNDPSEILRSWLLAGLVALCVARPLLPSEGVSWLGDGQPFDLAWIGLAVATLLVALARGSLPRPLDVVDLAVAALVVICVASALLGAHNPADELELGLTGNGSPRPAVNMLFEWVALGLTFFLVRQLVWTEREARALVAVMVALAVVLAGYGFYQVFVGLPAARAEYAANPDEVLTRLNQWFPAGSPERQRFENRLNSSEPLATFALTNSLAGFLGPWLLAALAIGASLFTRGERPPTSSDKQIAAVDQKPPWAALRAASLAACVLAVGGCFVLTKSRSGYVALALAVLLLPFAAGWGRRWLSRRVLAIGGAAVLALAVAAWLVGGLDVQVLTEGSKSLGYRLEYWQSTLAMIARYPFLGVGPGNFQDYYTQFKLPQASEEIRDPHNFLLEVWATAGSLALVALCAVLGIVAARTCLTQAVAWGLPPANDLPPRDQRMAVESTRNARFICGGAIAGLLGAFILGPLVGAAFSEQQLLGGLALGAVVAAILWPWVLRGTLPARLPALGVLLLIVHLSASGGIAFPGVAGSFWMLLALALDQLDGEPLKPAAAPTAAARLGVAAAVVLAACTAVASFSMACRPVLNCRALLTQAEEPGLDSQKRIQHYIEAANADPLSAEPWRAVAELEFARLHDQSSPQAMRYFVAAAKRLTELEPHSSAVWRQNGRWYQELHERNHDPESAEVAMESFRNAVELYPNFPTLRGEYALALANASEAAAAKDQAAKALELDAQTPHADKKLAAELKAKLESLR